MKDFADLSNPFSQARLISLQEDARTKRDEATKAEEALAEFEAGLEIEAEAAGAVARLTQAGWDLDTPKTKQWLIDVNASDSGVTITLTPGE